MTDLAARVTAEYPRAHELGMTGILDAFQARGEAVGEARGETRGQAKMLLRQLEHRFDELPDWVSARVNGGSADDLQTWADRVLDPDTTLADVFADD